MAKRFTKTQARKRLEEARSKVMLVMMGNYISLEQANKIIAPLSRLIDSPKFK